MKTYSIIYTSRTGNTRLLADTVREALPKEGCVFFGQPCEKALEAEILFAGFWTDKGACPESMAEFLRSVRQKKLFLFGTAGFGADQEYFNRILDRTADLLDPSNELLGTYMCQGKMPASVRERYVSMRDKEPERMELLIQNFDKALSHPDKDDFQRLAKIVKEIEAGLK